MSFFSPGMTVVPQKKLKTKVMQNFEVQTRYSILWELTNSEWQNTPFSIYWNSYLAPRLGGIKQKNSLLSLKMISFVLFPQAWCSQVWMLIYWNWSICYWAKRLIYRIMPNFQGLLVLLTECTEGRYYFCAHFTSISSCMLQTVNCDFRLILI